MIKRSGLTPILIFFGTPIIAIVIGMMLWPVIGILALPVGWIAGIGWLIFVATSLDDHLNRGYYKQQEMLFRERDYRRTACELGMSLAEFKEYIGENELTSEDEIPTPQTPHEIEEERKRRAVDYWCTLQERIVEERNRKKAGQ